MGGFSCNPTSYLFLPQTAFALRVSSSEPSPISAILGNLAAYAPAGGRIDWRLHPFCAGGDLRNPLGKHRSDEHEIHLRLEGLLSDAARKLVDISKWCNEPPRIVFPHQLFLRRVYDRDAAEYVPLFIDGGEGAGSYTMPLSLLTEELERKKSAEPAGSSGMWKPTCCAVWPMM